MKTKVEIRECAWVDGQAVKWQGHAYQDGRPFAEPLISGDPMPSKDRAKASLSMALLDYKELAKGADEIMSKEENFWRKKDEHVEELQVPKRIRKTKVTKEK